MEMQRAAMIGAVCCQNEDAEDFILAGSTNAKDLIALCQEILRL